MKLTLVRAYADNCPSCEMFKLRSWPELEKVLKENGIDYEGKVYSAPDYRTGFPNNVVPRFLTNVKYFPCLILMSTALFNSADKYTDREILSQLSVFNGSVTPSSTGVMGIYSSQTDQLPNTREGYITFISGYTNKNNTEKQKTSNGPVKACSPLIPICRYNRK